MNQRRTYWHLEALKRKPTDYEIATSNLLYHPERGFEVKVPAEDWYRKYQKGSPLILTKGEQFSDPRETTYTKYTAIQKDKEIYVDGLLRSMDETAYDKSLPPAWVHSLSRVLSPLRYPVHGLQMLAAYVGQMAPSGRIAVAALFQAGDEIRRVQRLAYRLRQLQETHPAFGQEGKEAWQRDPLWQPMRELIEKLLVTFDWGEAFVALNLVLKPMFDELFMVHYGELANRSGDPVLGKIFLSLNEDCRWHRDWSRALVQTALEESAQNQEVIRGWIRKWHAQVTQAVAAFGAVFGVLENASIRPEFSLVMNRIQSVCRDYWAAVIPLDSPG